MKLLFDQKWTLLHKVKLKFICYCGAEARRLRHCCLRKSPSDPSLFPPAISKSLDPVTGQLNNTIAAKMTALDATLRENVSKMVKSKVGVWALLFLAVLWLALRSSSMFCLPEHDGRDRPSGSRGHAGTHPSGLQRHLPEHRAARVWARLPVHVSADQRQLQTRNSGLWVNLGPKQTKRKLLIGHCLSVNFKTSGWMRICTVV